MKIFGLVFDFWKQEVIEVCLFHRPIWEAGSFAGVWESQIDIYLYYSSAAMSEAAHRLHHTKAGLPGILGLLYFGQDGDGLFCFGFFFTFFLLQDFSVALQHVSYQMQNLLQDRWIFKIHNCLAVTVLAGPQSTYNSSTGLTHYVSCVFAKIQTLEQIEALKICNIC